MGCKRGVGGHDERHFSAYERGHSLAGALVGHVHDVQAQRRLERFHGDVVDAADSGRTVGEFSRIGLGVGDEFGKCVYVE